MKVQQGAVVKFGWPCQKNRRWLTILENTQQKKFAAALFTPQQAMALAARLQRWALKISMKRRIQRAEKRIKKGK